MFSRIYLIVFGIIAFRMDLTISDMEILQSIENLSSFGSGTSTVISAAARAGSGSRIVVSVPSSSSSSSLSTTSATTTAPSILSSLNEQNSESFLYDIESINNRYSTAINMSKSVTNITVQIGTHAYLPCNIRRLLGKPVSWVRVRDGHILTVDQTTFIADQRFQSVYGDDNNNRWSLQIKYVQEHDMGLYECQVSTEPKMSSRVYLKVVVPKTELIGDQNRFVKAGSRVALHCIVRGSIEPPPYIIWYKGTKKITQDNKNGWFMQIDREIFGNNSDRQDTIGSLIILHVTKSDSGNYTCTPSNSSPVTVDLHVLSGEYSASAIMSSATTISNNWIILLLLFTILFVLNKT